MPEQDENAVGESATDDPEPVEPRAPSVSIDGADVPQTDDLARVRAVVDAVVARASSTEEVARAIGLSLRHAAYAIRAAVALELVDRAPGPFALSPSGVALSRTVPGSAEEATRLRDAVMGCPAVRAIAPNLLGRRGPSREVLARRIAKLATMAPATAERRAQTLLSWRRQLRGERRGGASVAAAAGAGISPAIEALLWDANPWWRNERDATVPPTRRAIFGELSAELDAGLAPVILLRGPRQAGKTTLLRQLVERELDAGTDPRRILRFGLGGPAELRKLRTPLLAVVRWYADRVLGSSLHQAAEAGKPVLIVVDHAHEHPDWVAELRHLVESSPVRMVVVGDGTMAVPPTQHGMAGQVTTLELPLLSLPDVAALRGWGPLGPWLTPGAIDALREPGGWRELDDHGTRLGAARDRAFAAFVERGGYPLAQARPDVPWAMMVEQLRESVIDRALLHDTMLGAAGERLERGALGRVFELVCSCAGSRLGPTLARAGQTDDFLASLGMRRTRAALDELAAALLVRLVEPGVVSAEARRTGATVCVADHALADAWLRRPPTLGRPGADAAASDVGLHAARSLVGYYLGSLRGAALVTPENAASVDGVDFVLRIGDRGVPMAIAPAPGVIDSVVARALRHLDDRRSAARFAVVVTMPRLGAAEAVEPAADADADSRWTVAPDPRLVMVPLSTLLLLR